MPSYRLPILIWQHSGGFTACLVEDGGNVAAVGETRSDAVMQLKDYVQWQFRRSGPGDYSEFGDPKLVWIKAEIRPEYQSGPNRLPTKETVLLRLPCVRGKSDAGLNLCAIPTIGVRFQLDDDASLTSLAIQYAQATLKGMTPQQLARHLPPESVELDDIVFQIPMSQSPATSAADLSPLPEVADAMGQRDQRRQLSRPWQRDAKVEEVVRLLARPRTNVLLVGESGVGKTAILTEAVRKVERSAAAGGSDVDSADGGAAESAPLIETRLRYWRTSSNRLISGMKYLGQWQERCEEVVETLSEIGGVLCVDNLQDLVRLGGETPAESLAAFLLPYLQRQELRMVVECTAAELDACQRVLPAFVAAFNVVEVPQMTPQQAIAALDEFARTRSRDLKVQYDRGVIEQVFRLFSRFMPYVPFPGKAVEFVAELFDRAGRSKETEISSRSAVDRFVKKTGIPEIFLRPELPLKTSDVFEHLQAKVRGQASACRVVASALTTFKAGLNDPGRPLGVMLFCGPTGVGKTELAKALAEFVFGRGEKGDRLVRLDMSEYSGHYAAERLLGTPGGEPSDWIKTIRQQPFNVVLLDEIEKAAPDVFDVLLSVLDEGRITDRFGRTTTFRSTFIIMTSNLGAAAAEPFGLKTGVASSVATAVERFFRPEFLNRVDSVVTFSPLAPDTVREIAESELRNIANRDGLTSRRIRLRWSDDVVASLCHAGYDPRYGARPLQRAIEHTFVTPMSRHLVEHPEAADVTLRASLDASSKIHFAIEE